MVKIKQIISEDNFISIQGKAYRFPHAALVVDKSILGAKLKMESLIPKEPPIFVDVELNETQRVELRCIMNQELQGNEFVNPHENFVLTGNLVVADSFSSPKVSIQSMQVMRRLYACVETPVIDVTWLYIVCDQKIAIAIDREGKILDRQRYVPTTMLVTDLLNQLDHCAVSESPLDVKLERGGNRQSLLLPRMVHGWHAQVATVIRDFINPKQVRL